jgi:hypothetical protein
MQSGSKRPVQIVYFFLLILSVVLLVSSLSTSWTRINVSSGFSNLTYDLALRLTGMTTCVTTPFTGQSCSSTSWSDYKKSDSGQGKHKDNQQQGGGGIIDIQNGSEDQSSCKSDLMASETLMFLAISLPLIGFGCYLVQDYVTKLKESGASWPMMIGVGLSFLFTVITIVVWATGGCYAGFEKSLSARSSGFGGFVIGSHKVELGE